MSEKEAAGLGSNRERGQRVWGTLIKPPFSPSMTPLPRASSALYLCQISTAAHHLGRPFLGAFWPGCGWIDGSQWVTMGRVGSGPATPPVISLIVWSIEGRNLLFSLGYINHFILSPKYLHLSMYV